MKGRRYEGAFEYEESVEYTSVVIVGISDIVGRRLYISISL